MSDPASGMEAPGYKAPRWAWWVATGFGSGLLKPAPGTWGSLAAIPFWLLVFHLCRFGGGVTQSPWSLRFLLWELPIGLALLGYGLLAVIASGKVEAEGASIDPGFIVADEWIGMGISLWFLRDQLAFWPLSGDGSRWMTIIANALVLLVPFALFRLFDIWKPWPCKRLQDLHGGLGIVLDDVAAGIWAALILVALRFIFFHAY